MREPFRYYLRVRYNECDAQRVVFNGHYGTYVDMAVTECENALKLDSGICLAHYQLAKHYKSVLDKDLALQNCRGLIRCSGDTKNGSEVADCKTIVQALEVQ